MSTRHAKNGTIELLRFIFCIGVILFHCHRIMGVDLFQLPVGRPFFFNKGYIGVEFFFLVTGFLMAASVKSISERERGMDYDLAGESMGFMWRKMKAILPYHIIAFLMVLPVDMAMKGVISNGVKSVIATTIKSLPSFLLIHKWGFNGFVGNRITWYISAMLLGMIILFPLLRKHYDIMSRYVFPFGGILILGIVAKNYGGFNGTSTWVGFAYVCVLRAIAEMALGVACHTVYLKLGSVRLTPLGKRVLSILEIVCYISVFIYGASRFREMFDIYALIALMIAIPITFSRVTKLGNMFDNDLCYFLGAMSLPLYLAQLVGIELVQVSVPGWNDVIKVMLVLVITFAAALIIRILGNLILKKIDGARWKFIVKENQEA